jgi:hypothetical protein
MPENPTPLPQGQEPAGPPPPAHEGNGAVNPAVRYEPKDVSPRGVYTFAGALVALLLLVGGGVWLLFGYYGGREEAAKKPVDYWSTHDRAQRAWQPYQKFAGWVELPAIDRADHSRLHELPRLEKVLPEYTVQMQVADEEDYLSSTGWVKGEKGVVHIPIEQAMKKTMAQLNETARDGDATEEFYRAPSRSSSGQQPRGGRK